MKLLTRKMKTEMKFTTESGSTYLFDSRSLTRIRDVEDTNLLRRDGDPVDVLSVIELVVGKSAQFILDIRKDGVPTLRTTSPITSIEHND